MTKAEFIKMYNGLSAAEKHKLVGAYVDLSSAILRISQFTDDKMILAWVAEAHRKLRYIDEAKKDNRRKIRAVMSKLYTDEIVACWNQYVANVNKINREVYPMEEFNERMEWRPALDIVADCLHGNFGADDAYYWIDENDHLISFNLWDDKESPIDMDAMVEYMADRSKDLGVSGVEEILKEAA